MEVGGAKLVPVGAEPGPVALMCLLQDELLLSCKEQSQGTELPPGVAKGLW